jgi:tRNA (cytidine/uridine-2'-O-)-methyltransferase
VSEGAEPVHPRLASPLFHIVLHQPEIPNNTGNIGRTCVAVSAVLHLIRPLGFSTSEKACRRAGLDYWSRLDVREHESWSRYTATHPNNRRWLFSTKARRTVFDAQLRRGDHLIFGRETAGLPDELLSQAGPERVLGLPMATGERSLNVATAVCAAVYEGIRQLIAGGDLGVAPDGRLIT